MKEIFFLLLLIFPCSIKTYIKKVLNQEINLDTNIGENYFFIPASNFNHKIVYFYLFDTSYGLSNVNYCIVKDDLTYKQKINCNFKSIYPYRTYTNGKTKENYYKVTLDPSIIFDQSIGIRYTGTNTISNLTAKASYSDLCTRPDPSSSSNSSSSSSSSKKLSTVAIVFIVIGSVIFATVIIGLICYACKRRADAERLAYENYTNPPTVTITPTPLVVPTNVYTAY